MRKEQPGDVVDRFLSKTETSRGGTKRQCERVKNDTKAFQRRHGIDDSGVMGSILDKILLNKSVSIVFG